MNSTPHDGACRSLQAFATLELVVALAILTVVMLPLGFAFSHEQKLCRAYYHRAVVMEILDGELEVLAAGESRAFQEGSQSFPVRAQAAKNLPPGRFVLTVTKDRLRLEWIPENRGKGGRVLKEIVSPSGLKSDS